MSSLKPGKGFAKDVDSHFNDMCHLWDTGINAAKKENRRKNPTKTSLRRNKAHSKFPMNTHIHTLALASNTGANIQNQSGLYFLAQKTLCGWEARESNLLGEGCG